MFIAIWRDDVFTLATIPHVVLAQRFFFDEVLHACAERSFLGSGSGTQISFLILKK